MGACCATAFAPGSHELCTKRKGITIAFSLAELMQNGGDPEAAAAFAAFQGVMRRFLIKRGVLRDKKYADKLRKEQYFSDADYFETMQPKNEIPLAMLSPKRAQDLPFKVYTYQHSQATYSGQWLGGFRHGEGTLVFTDGTRYSGQWQLGQPHGIGRFEMQNGTKYEGQFSLGRWHGKGKSVDQAGTVYVGDFALDRKHGFGKTKDLRGDYYKGAFVEGKQTGFGTKKFKTGAIYEGQWVDNQIQGFGFYLTAKMDKSYTGSYRDNKMEGFGVMQWTDGRRYKGLWKEDLKHGFGEQVNADGSSVRGTFIQGKLFGFGVYASKSNAKRHGVWQQGKKVATLTEEQVAQIQSGELAGSDLLEATEEEWAVIREYSSGLLKPCPGFATAERLYETEHETHK